MKASTLLQGMAESLGHDPWINGLSLDSRQVKAGDLFFAIPGYQKDGRLFINDALNRGAVLVLAEGQTFTDPSLPVIGIQELQKKIGSIASRFYKHPSHQCKVTAITGTNGKSTCSYLLAYFLTKVEQKAWLSSTLGCGLSDELKPSSLTTPDALLIQQMMSDAIEKQCKHVVLETSSHALDQYRLDGTQVQMAIFTNLTHDHLDYHKTLEAYGKAKLRLFTEFEPKMVIVNDDDPYSYVIQSSLKSSQQVLTYGLRSSATVQAEKILYTPNGLEITIRSPWGRHIIRNHMLGAFNVYNLLAVFSALCLHGIAITIVEDVLAHPPRLRGRMQLVTSTKTQPTIVVDYAHTPDALYKVLCSLKEHRFKRIWCIFGCGGDRDRHKRPRMGQLAQEFADEVIITNDNPRSENPHLIVKDIIGGMMPSSNVHIVMDRQEAIKKAITEAQAEDVILIAGKGHETYQLIGQQRMPFDDVEVARALMISK